MEGKELKIHNRSRHQIRINLAVATDLVKAYRLRKLIRHNLFKTTYCMFFIQVNPTIQVDRQMQRSTIQMTKF